MAGRLGSPTSTLDIEDRDIRTLADLIGISRDEPEYLWIAKEAYNADLPVGWQIFFDEEGKHFYFDPKTETSTTQHPCIGYYQELYQTFKDQDAEFKKQQEAQELAMGLNEESKKLQSQKKVVDGDDEEATGDVAEDVLEEAREAGEAEIVAKAKLLQAYSNDPNLASHYRKDMQEQDQRSSEILQTILRREEDLFLQRLRLYVTKKDEAGHAPLESILAEYSESSKSHVEEALHALTQQFDGFKVQIHELAEAVKNTPTKQKKSAIDQRAAKFANMSPVSKGSLSPLHLAGSHSPGEGHSPSERHLGDECESCAKRKEKIKELEEQLKTLKDTQGEGGGNAKDSGAPEDDAEKKKREEQHEKEKMESQREIDNLQMKLAAANMKNKQQKEELQKLKTMLASSMVQEINQDESREQMDQLSQEARKRDALGWESEGSRPATSVSRPGTSGSVAFSQLDASRPGTAGSASTTATGFAERFTASGMSPDMMLQVLERVEAMSAEGRGPIHQIKTEKQELLAEVEQQKEEVQRLREQNVSLEEQNKQHVLSLAKMDAQKSEIVRAKEHSEHMEFLAQQYASQVQNLQDMLRKLRDQVAQSQLKVDQDKERSKQHALAHGSSADAGTGTGQKGKDPFSVRVRSATILDVKRSTSTLRSAINLLRIDFQSYAEGIFLPLARELQQSTLYLATSLSAKARDLRICTDSLSLAFASQRLLENKLHHVYKISFHSLAYLREAEEDEENNFRTAQPRSLTMKILNGFENKKDLLEIYEFEKVISPENDPVTIFQELTPFFARILNWDSACLILSGGRFSKKEDLLMGIELDAGGGKTEHCPGIFEQAVEYVSHIYKDEKDRLEKTRKTDQYDLQFFLEYSEVLDEETMHFVSGIAEESQVMGQEGSKVSLTDMQKMLSSAKKPNPDSKDVKEGSGNVSRTASAAGGEEKDNEGTEEEKRKDGSESKDIDGDDDGIDEDNEEHEEHGPHDADGDERAVFLPTFSVEAQGSVSIITKALQMLKAAQSRSAGRLDIKQKELERNASEKVARAKRLAKKGSRNEMGEVMQEPHKVLSLMIVKRDRATDEKLVALLKIVILGCPAEMEDPKSEVCKFREEMDQSRYTVMQYLERKYIRETDINVKLNDSALSALIWDTMDTDSSVVLLSCVSPCVDHFNDTIKDLRYACKSRKERPTTAARLERVKFRWQNQSAAWAFTLWKGAVADSVQIQLNHEIDNLTQEMDEVKSENKELKEKLQFMAYEGVEYLSDKDQEESDGEQVEDTDVLAQQRQMLEKAIGKELFKLKEKQEGAVMQTVIAKMQYAQSKQHALLDKNKALSRMLQHETKMRRSKSSLGRSHPHTGNLRRSKTAMGDASMERSGMLPPVQGIRGGDQAWGDPSERASKKQALGRTR